MNKPTKTALSVFLVLSASGASADNLLEVYNLAKDNDPTFLGSEAGRMATNERVNQSLASLLPNLSAAADYTISNNESSRLDTGIFTPNAPTPDNPAQTPTTINTIDESETDTDGYGWSLTLNQEIYNHATWENLRRSEKTALQSNVNHEGARHDLIIRVAEAYFNVLAAIDSVEFAKAETEAVSKQLAQTKQRFDVGLIAMTDVHEAQSQYDRAVAAQISSQNGLDNAHEVLQEITGQYHYGLLGLKPTIPLRNPQPEDIKQWVKKSEANNVAIKASRIGLDIAKKSIDVAWAGHLPSVNLQARLSSSDRDTESPAFQRENDLGEVIGDVSNFVRNSQPTSTSVAINLSVPLYSGGLTNSQVKEAQSLYQQSAHNFEASHRQAVRETRSSYLGVVAAVSSVNALNQAVISSQSALEATQAGFEVGTRTIVDVLQQTQALFFAKRDHARARYDYILNTLRLKRAAGLLSEKDLAQINEMLR